VLGLSALVGSIALADSVNPSTVVPALYLSRRPDAGSALARFIAGVFLVYLAGGLVLVLGPGPALIGTLRHVGALFAHAAEAAGGIALLAVAAVAWRSRGGADAGRSPGPRAALLTGAAISAVELPTAFMYFGAVSAVLGVHVAIPARVGLMVVYNLIFAAPLLIILVVRLRARDTGWGELGRVGDGLIRAAPFATAAVAAAAGAALLGVGLAGLISRLA